MGITRKEFYTLYKTAMPYTGDKSIILHFEDNNGRVYKLNTVGCYENKESSKELSLLEMLQQRDIYRPTVILQDNEVYYLF